MDKNGEAVRRLHGSLQPLLMCSQGPAAGQLGHKRAELQDLLRSSQTSPFFCILSIETLFFLLVHNKKLKRA